MMMHKGLIYDQFTSHCVQGVSWHSCSCGYLTNYLTSYQDLSCLSSFLPLSDSHTWCKTSLIINSAKKHTIIGSLPANSAQ